MKFICYIGKRMLHLLPVLFGISLMAFLLGIFSPGDPAQMALSQGVNEPTEEEIEHKREELGLDRPIHEQYVCWLQKVVHGDLGTSYLTKKPISSELFRRAPVTIKVAVLSVLLVIFIGILLGLLMSLCKKSILYRILNFISIGVISIPGFCIALLLIWVFSEKLRILPTSGIDSWKSFVLYRILNFISIGVISIPGFCIALLLIWVFSEKLRILPTSGIDSWKSFVMPAFALALPTIGTVMRLTESSLEKEFSRPYVVAAYSKGFSTIYITVMHTLRNSMISVVTTLGNYFGGILGGSAVIEGIFSIPGMGSYALSAISGRDYPALQGYVLITGFIFVIIHLLVDLISYWLNPQIRLEGDI